MSRALTILAAGNRAGRMRWLRVGGALLSGVLLATAFPPLAEAQTAWFALIPLLMAVRHVRMGAAFRLGWLSGTAFWLGSGVWLLRLGQTGCSMPTAVGAWLALALFMGLYTGGFAVTASWAMDRLGGGETRADLARRLLLPAVIAILWVGFEYARATLFTGFPWNGLGVSQYRNLPILQLAEWGGVYAVSALVAAVNTGIMLMLLRLGGIYFGGRPARLQVELMLVLLVLALCWTRGVYRVRAMDAAQADYGKLRVAAIQPNIPQLKKWPDAYALEIMAALDRRMDMVRATGTELDLVVWPETAVPGSVPRDAQTMAYLGQMARESGIPLLVGAMEVEEEPRERWYNSSFLLDETGAMRGRYRKQHLVPFGEYLPLSAHVPWLDGLAPMGFNCSAGTTGTIFRLDRSSVPFGVLICFEDVFPRLARRAVRAGARLLVNQTNDAYFDGSAAAVQHMAHGVFRSVENRVPTVRAANTGVTCFIDSSGRIDQTTRDIIRRGEWDLIDCRIETVRVPPENRPSTFYARHGDWPLAIPSALAALAALAAAWRASREETIRE